MTRLEIMNHNKKLLSDILKEGKYKADEKSLEFLVRYNLITAWVKGNKWMGGISDGLYQKISDRIAQYGYDEMAIYDEFDRQIAEILAYGEN